jgi:hypothetical protein
VRKLIAGLALALGFLGLAAQVAAQNSLAAAALKPEQPFAAALAPPAPDYAKDEAWAGLPDRADAVDVVPDGSTDGQALAKVDVFFVHPTTYFGKENWNAAYEGQGGGGVAGVDAGTMRAQASVFNGCCRVFAPRYRQATLASFFDEAGSGKQAIDLAYSDVDRAFTEFLKRIKGRPFILAGHSQGSLHLTRLIKARVIGTPLQKRFVAGYLIGSGLHGGDLKLPLCAGAAQTGCLVNWNAVTQAVADERKAKMPDEPPTACINPLTWTIDGAAPASANLGAIHGQRGGPLGAPLPAYTGAQCDHGMLVIDTVGPPFMNPLVRGGVYHIYDYNLFYMNLRANAAFRAKAFFKR